MSDTNMQLAEIQQVPTPATTATRALSIFNDAQTFAAAAKMAEFLAKSTLVPKDYQNNPSNAMIAIDIANRIGASPMMVMQNLYVIHGKPSWSSQFIISAINSCGRFSPLMFDVQGTGAQMTCKAYCSDTSGKTLEGPTVSIKMAEDEGWATKPGSKWKTMPDLMIRYRAAAFFGRLYCPDILNGMYTADEVADFATPEPRATSAPVAVTVKQEPQPEQDTTPVTNNTINAISAALAALQLRWSDGATKARVCTIIGRVIAEDAQLDDITEAEGVRLLAALNKRIAEKAQTPKGGVS